jgi:hypothetical protein
MTAAEAIVPFKQQDIEVGTCRLQTISNEAVR